MNFIIFIINIFFGINIFLIYYLNLLINNFLIYIGVNKYYIIKITNLLINLSVFFISNISTVKNIKIDRLNLINKNIIINCNHTGLFDDLLILVLLKKFNVKTKSIKSVSLLSNKLEETVFNYIDYIVVKKNDLKKMNDKLEYIINNYKNIALICFFKA